MSDRILPCPFCGGDAMWFSHMRWDENREAYREEYSVKCLEVWCLARTSRWDTKEDAIAAWNRRDG